MDSAHVSLVTLAFTEKGFETYKCDKPITLGINLVNFAKILRMAISDDTLTIKADEEISSLQITLDNKCK